MKDRQSPREIFQRAAPWLLAAGIVAVLAWNSANFFFRQPYYEYWDSAANSLSILRAKHFRELYGPYSRFNFHHPGVAFFYLQALGEWLFFDWWHLVPTPFQGQTLIHLCAMAAVYAATLGVWARRLPTDRRNLFVCVALVLGILHFGWMRHLSSIYDVLGGATAFLSPWTGHSVVPMLFCLLTVGTLVATGRGQALPWLVIVGGFLLEHIAEVLFVSVISAAAYGGLLVHCAARRGEPPRRWALAAWREFPRAHWVAGGCAFVFALPLLIDLTKGSQSNFVALWNHARAGEADHKTLVRSLAFFLQYGAYAPYQTDRIDFGRYDAVGFLRYIGHHALLFAGWVWVTALVWRRAATISPADETGRFLTVAARFAVLAVALSLFWGTHQDGPLYYFSSWVNYGIYYFAAVLAAADLCTGRFVRGLVAALARPALRWVPLGAVCLVGALCASAWRIQDIDFSRPEAMDPSRPNAIFLVASARSEMHASVERALALPGANDPATCKVLCFPTDDWFIFLGIALQLARAGQPFVTVGRWAVAFGQDADWRLQETRALHSPLRPWYFVPPGDTPWRVADDAPSFPLPRSARLMLTPPTLEWPETDIDFGTEGNTAGYRLGGWDVPDPYGTWSDQPWTALAFRPSTVQGKGVEITVEGEPYVSPASGLTRQRLRLYFCGVPVGGERQLSTVGTLKFEIPAEQWNREAAKPEPVISLAFELPDAVVPATLKGSGSTDPRELGIFFRHVRLRAEP